MRTVAVTRILDVIRTGSTRPLLVETPEGRFVCKLVHGADGPRTLAAEWIGTKLCAAFGLPSLDLVALDLPRERAVDILDTEVREMIERGAGLCLGSRELRDARIAKPHELAAADDDFALRLLALDRLIENPDRRAANPNVLRWGESLVPIDHASSLAFHNDWRIDEHTPTEDCAVPRDHLYAARCDRPLYFADPPKAGRERRDFADPPKAGRERRDFGIDRSVFEAICLAIPEPWLGRREFATFDRQRHAYAAYLWKRQKALR